MVRYYVGSEPTPPGVGPMGDLELEAWRGRADREEGRRVEPAEDRTGPPRGDHPDAGVRCLLRRPDEAGLRGRVLARAGKPNHPEEPSRDVLLGSGPGRTRP